MADPKLKSYLDRLERNLTGARKVGLFGHRNVGKTTLLAMFYRQASSGQVPGLRLSAPEPETAEYLAEKIARIEAGESPAGTLSETELKLRLYHGPARYDLIIKDYQGEHIALGSGEPILDFFADCDAVMLCLDPVGSVDLAERRRRQMEIENLLEGYIDQSEDSRIDRPIAVVVTKYDQVIDKYGADGVERLLEDHYGMTLHAVRNHAPRSAAFAVSAYGMGGGQDGKPPADLQPLGLDGPLTWVAEQLESTDREQLEWIWDLAPHDYSRLKRCVDAYDVRYPKSKKTIDYRRQLRTLKRKRFLGRVAKTAAVVGLGLGGLASYDYFGYQGAAAFEKRKSVAPIDVVERWESALTWHPTLGYLWPSLSKDAKERLTDWRLRADLHRLTIDQDATLTLNQLQTFKERFPDKVEQIRTIELALLKKRQEQEWNEIQGKAALPDAQADELLGRLRRFLADYPATSYKDEAVKLAQSFQSKAKQQQSKLDEQEAENLILASQLPNSDPIDLIERCRKFLDRRPESEQRPKIEALLTKLKLDLDQRDFETAREFSRRHPTNFVTRIERFEKYIQTHQSGGKYLSQAIEAKDKILDEWDSYDYRQAYDHWQSHPNDVGETAKRLNEYLRDHPDGRYAEAAKRHGEWFAKISAPAEYRVKLRRGQVSRSVAKSWSGGGPDLSVSLEVTGVTYPSSSIVPNSFTPIWDYAFPRPIVWKLGDPITIRITDHDWSDSVVYVLNSDKNDPLAIKLLSGPVHPSRGGDTMLVFESDFTMPVLPAPE